MILQDSWVSTHDNLENEIINLHENQPLLGRYFMKSAWNHRNWWPKTLKNIDFHGKIMIFMILVYPLRFSFRAFYRKLSENWKIMKKQKNEENHGFSDFLWFLHILGIFADFQQNGNFYEIRKIQINLHSKLLFLEHFFINPIFGLKTIDLGVFHQIEVFYEF